ncbi:toprim domain-containing protein [Candidatus Bathyarchaeota archaeon]|nr:toprim domain-containing protein [Candidatus Bathyarchaeota archaeon]
MGLERKLEKISYVIERLKSEISVDALLVVEGEKDIKALRDMGIACNIVAVKSSGKSVPDIIDEIISTGSKEIILLMDFDRRGKELTKRLVESLEAARIKVDISFWKEIYSILNNDVKDIEGLAAYIRTLKRKVEGNETINLLN